MYMSTWGYGGIGRRNGLKGTSSFILGLLRETLKVHALKFKETLSLLKM
jgi:hypothetical protein